MLREVARAALRARNGIRYASGTEWTPVAATPSDIAWRQGSATLLHYRSDAVIHRPPVLLFLGLISRSFILDLQPGNSFVERLCDAGFDVWLLDWGIPDAADADNTIETYVSTWLPRAAQVILRETKSDELSMIGYCMGGNLALLAAASGQVPLRNLVTIATPVAMGELGTLTDALRKGALRPDELIDQTGNVPGQALRNFFRVRKPTADLVQYATLLENLWSDEYVAGHRAMGRWIREQPPVPGAAFRQIVQDWLQADGFRNGTLRLGGRRVDLAAIRHPVLSVVALRDEIIPPSAALPIQSLLPNADFELLKLDAGHVGLAASRKAAKETIPSIARWLEEHSDERVHADVHLRALKPDHESHSSSAPPVT
jgi:polyhydroxyalkanoate synthase